MRGGESGADGGPDPTAVTGGMTSGVKRALERGIQTMGSQPSQERKAAKPCIFDGEIHKETKAWRLNKWGGKRWGNKSTALEEMTGNKWVDLLSVGNNWDLL